MFTGVSDVGLGIGLGLGGWDSQSKLWPSPETGWVNKDDRIRTDSTIIIVIIVNVAIINIILITVVINVMTTITEKFKLI